MLGSTKKDCAIGLIQFDCEDCLEVVSVTIPSSPKDSLLRSASLVEMISFSLFCKRPLALNKVSETVVVEAISLFAWSVIRTILSPALNVPAGILISPATSPLSFVCNLDIPLAKIPLVFATIVLIVPLAELESPVITLAAANPTAEFVNLLFCDVTWEECVALVFPVMSVMKRVATLLTVFDEIRKIPLLLAESLIISPFLNAPFALLNTNFLAPSVLAFMSVSPIKT